MTAYTISEWHLQLFFAIQEPRPKAEIALSGRDSQASGLALARALNAAHSVSYSGRVVSCHQQIPSCL